MAARSFHAVVLGLDRRRVALRNAYGQGVKVVYQDDFRATSLSSAEFIKARMPHQPKLKAVDFVSTVTESDVK